MQTNRVTRILGRAVLGLGLGLFASPGFADTTWTAGDSDWSTPANWSAGEPTSGNRAVISNGGTAHVGTGEQTNGMLLGNLAANSGTLKIQDAADSLESFGHNAVVTVGNLGSGTIIQSAGTVTLGSDASATQSLTLGTGATGTGSYQLSGGTLTTYGTVNIGSAGVGTFTQSAGTHHVAARTGVTNTGRLFMSSGSTYDLTGGTLNVSGNGLTSLGTGGSGTARLTVNGPSVNASFASTLTVGSTSQALLEFKQGTLNVAGNFLVGNGSTGTVTQTGGTLTSTSASAALHLGSAAAGTGTYNHLGGTLSLAAGALGRDLVVGSSGNGTFNLGNAAGRGSLTQNATGADVIVRFSAGASGTFRGWSDDGVTNNISMSGSFTNNGVVIADGYGTDRSLNLSSYSSITNSSTIDNGVNEANGWFAQDNGKLVLKTVTAPANGSVNWGELTSDTTIDLINSVRLTTTTGVTAGTLDIALLATDRTDAASAIAAAAPNQLISLFQLTPGTFGFNTGSATFTTRYDHTGLVGGESGLKLLLYSGGNWADVTASVDTTNRRITSNSLSSFGGGYLAVAVVPEPTILSISAGALGFFLRRPRRFAQCIAQQTPRQR